MNEQAVREKLNKTGQSHVLRFWNELKPEQRNKLIGQLSPLDLDAIAELAETHVRHKSHIPLQKVMEPVQAFPREPDAARRQLYEDAEQRGHEMLRQGKVGGFLVAGGQGTRLGYDGPKGEFPV